MSSPDQFKTARNRVLISSAWHHRQVGRALHDLGAFSAGMFHFEQSQRQISQMGLLESPSLARQIRKAHSKLVTQLPVDIELCASEMRWERFQALLQIGMRFHYFDAAAQLCKSLLKHRRAMQESEPSEQVDAEEEEEVNALVVQLWSLRFAAERRRELLQRLEMAHALVADENQCDSTCLRLASGYLEEVERSQDFEMQVSHVKELMVQRRKELRDQWSQYSGEVSDRLKEAFVKARTDALSKARQTLSELEGSEKTDYSLNPSIDEVKTKQVWEEIRLVQQMVDQLDAAFECGMVLEAPDCDVPIALKTGFFEWIQRQNRRWTSQITDFNLSLELLAPNITRLIAQVLAALHQVRGEDHLNSQLYHLNHLLQRTCEGIAALEFDTAQLQQMVDSRRVELAALHEVDKKTDKLIHDPKQSLDIIRSTLNKLAKLPADASMALDRARLQTRLESKQRACQALLQNEDHLQAALDAPFLQSLRKQYLSNHQTLIEQANEASKNENSTEPLSRAATAESSESSNLVDTTMSELKADIENEADRNIAMDVTRRVGEALTLKIGSEASALVLPGVLRAVAQTVSRHRLVAWLRTKFREQRTRAIESLSARLAAELVMRRTQLEQVHSVVSKLLFDMCSRWLDEHSVNRIHNINVNKHVWTLAWRVCNRSNILPEELEIVADHLQKHPSVVINEDDDEDETAPSASWENIIQEYEMVKALSSNLKGKTITEKAIQEALRDWDRAYHWGDARDKTKRAELVSKIAATSADQCAALQYVKRSRMKALQSTLTDSLMDDTNINSERVFRKLHHLREKRKLSLEDAITSAAEEVTQNVLGTRIASKVRKLLSQRIDGNDEDDQAQLEKAFTSLCEALTQFESLGSIANIHEKSVQDRVCRLISDVILREWVGEQETNMIQILREALKEFLSGNATIDESDEMQWNSREQQIERIIAMAIEQLPPTSNISPEILRDALQLSTSENQEIFAKLENCRTMGAWNRMANEVAAQLTQTHQGAGIYEHRIQPEPMFHAEPLVQRTSRAVHRFVFRSGTPVPKKALRWIEQICVQEMSHPDHRQVIGLLTARSKDSQLTVDVARAIARQLKTSLPELLTAVEQEKTTFFDRDDVWQKALHAVGSALKKVSVEK